MLTSKYIAHFLEEVSHWQKRLSTADQVINIWFEVQRTWSHLESIFVGSGDIRKQLPLDSDRFDEIDTNFKVGILIFYYKPNSSQNQKPNFVKYCTFCSTFEKNVKPFQYKKYHINTDNGHDTRDIV